MFAGFGFAPSTLSHWFPLLPPSVSLTVIAAMPSRAALVPPWERSGMAENTPEPAELTEVTAS